MENNKPNILFYVVVVAFVLLFVVLIKDFKAQRANDFKGYIAAANNIVKRDNYRMNILFNELAAAQKENQDLKNTLAETRNSLESLSNKLAQPAPAAAPAPASAPAPTPAAATK